jgi:hypothetical protein
VSYDGRRAATDADDRAADGDDGATDGDERPPHTPVPPAPARPNERG